MIEVLRGHVRQHVFRNSPDVSSVLTSGAAA